MKGCSTWHLISDRKVRTFMRVPGHQTWLQSGQTVVDITGNTTVADMPRHLSYLGPACPLIPLNICLRWSTDGVFPEPWASHIRGQPFPDSLEDTVVFEGSRRPPSLLKATPQLQLFCVAVADNRLSLHMIRSSFSLAKRTRAVWPQDRR